jgi:hypothetical protein
MSSTESIRVVILSTIDEMSKESGMARIEDFYDYLKEKHSIDRVTAGKVVVELFKEGKLQSPLYHFIKTT